jgi:hypothetical protein
MAIATSQTKQPQPDFELEVRTILWEERMTVTNLALKIGKSRNNTSIAINHPSMFPGIKALIRKELGMSA